MVIVAGSWCFLALNCLIWICSDTAASFLIIATCRFASTTPIPITQVSFSIQSLTKEAEGRWVIRDWIDKSEKKTNCMRSEQPEESRWFYSMRIMWHTRKSFTKLGSNGRTNVCSTTERWLWCKFIEQRYRSYQPLCQLIIRWNPSKSPGPAVRSELGRRFETSPNGSLEEI